MGTIQNYGLFVFGANSKLIQTELDTFTLLRSVLNQQ